MNFIHILEKNNCTLLSDIKAISCENSKDIDILCPDPRKTLNDISSKYKILWSRPNLSSGTTSLVWDKRTAELFRIDLIKDLCLVTERIYPKRIRIKETLRVGSISEDLNRFKALRKFVKGQLKSENIDHIYNNQLKQRDKDILSLEKIPLMIRLKNRFLKFFTKPKKIAFLGPDGAGKSTAIDSFLSDVSSGFGHVKYIHLKVELDFARRQEQRAKKINLKPHAKKPYSYSKSSVKYLYLLLQYLLGTTYLNVRYSSKDLMVFDRYYHDILVDPLRFRLQKIKFFESLIKTLLPTPDIIVIISANESIIFKRKQDLTLDEIKRQLSEYAKIATPNVLRLNNEDISEQNFCVTCRTEILNRL